MRVKFDCPTCGKNDLIEVRDNVQTECLLEEINEVGEEVDIEMSMVDTDFGDLVCYMCDHCQDKIEDIDGNPILDSKELFDWLNKNGMLEGDKNGKE